MRRLIILSFITVLSLVSLRADDFSLMRERLLREIVLGDPSDPALSLPENAEAMRSFCSISDNEAESVRRSFLRDTSALWPDLPYLSGNRSFTPAHICESYRRLLLMARAYSWPGCSLYHNEDILRDVRYGLSFLYTHAYNERTRMIGNWWEWRIGIPWYYSYIVSMLRDNLSPEEISAFERATSAFTYSFARNGDLTFANQASICRNLLFIGILSGNDTYIRTALNAAVPAFYDASTPAQRMQAVSRQNNIIRRQRSSARVSSLVHKEGLYSDGTFIQHSSVPYIGTYGTEVIAMASYLAILLPETKYTVPEEISESLFLWVYGAYLPAIWRGQMMLMFCGRSVDADVYANAREVEFSVLRAQRLLPAPGVPEVHILMARLANFFVYPSSAAAAYESYGADLPIRLAAKESFRQLAEQGNSDIPFSRVYAAGDRAIHKRQDWCFGLSMSSNRIAKYECFIRPTARQNTQGWYQGDGMTYLYLPSDEEQYRNYFSFVDPYRLPGTTVVWHPREEEQAVQPLYAMPSAAADEARAGGVSLAGGSSAMMQLVGAYSNLRAKKSWFMFSREVVCLGADISCSDSSQVITTVENRRNHSSLSVWPEKGHYHKLPATTDVIACGPVRLAYLEGVGAYWFPDAPGLLAETNNEGTTCFWLSHDEAPQQASYSYVLLPEMPVSDAMLYSRQPDVRILRNTPEMQAVHHFGLNLTAVNFWKSGALVADGDSSLPLEGGVGGGLAIRSDGMAALMMRQTDDALYISVSDPSWDRPSMQLILEGVYDLRSADKSDKIKVSTLAGCYTIIDIDSRNALGMSFDLILEKKEPAFVQTWSPLPY